MFLCSTHRIIHCKMCYVHRFSSKKKWIPNVVSNSFIYLFISFHAIILPTFAYHLHVYQLRLGLGRSKFLPKPLPEEINVLLSDCDLNFHHDGSEKATLPAPSQPSTTTIATTQMLTTGAPSACSSRSVETYEDDGDDSKIG